MSLVNRLGAVFDFSGAVLRGGVLAGVILTGNRPHRELALTRYCWAKINSPASPNHHLLGAKVTHHHHGYAPHATLYRARLYVRQVMHRIFRPRHCTPAQRTRLFLATTVVAEWLACWTQAQKGPG